MRGILAATREFFFSADDRGVSGAQANGKRVRQFPRTRNSLYKELSTWVLAIARVYENTH
jgi:hypothetical protein